MFLFKSALEKSEGTMNTAWADLDTARDVARKSGLRGQDIEDKIRDQQVEAYLAEEDYYHRRDQKWLQKMYKLELAVPHQEETSEIWETSIITHQWLLTEKGFNHIRATVREEQKQRRQPWAFFLTITIAIIAAITGLAAALAAIF